MSLCFLEVWTLSDEHCIPFSQERIHLARQIEKAEYRNFQACLHNSWIEQAAAALEIELEEEMYKGEQAAWDLKNTFSIFCLLFPSTFVLLELRHYRGSC